ncbi:MAG: hypothetical protein GX810_04095 [Clostridiales bacterium]|nr:hypothetical protein [Clostridiales bacterium]
MPHPLPDNTLRGEAVFDLIQEAHALLKPHGFPYAFCGGWAIDLFVGAQTRAHGDIDVLAYWPERGRVITVMQSLGFRVYEMFGGGMAREIFDVRDQVQSRRSIFCVLPGCKLVRLSDADQSGVARVDFRPVGQTRLDFLEFLFNHISGTDLIYARNPAIRQPVQDAIRYHAGIPYLSPEHCLLYKASDPTRAGYQHDYDTAMARMNERQRQWLADSLRAMYPEGHVWLA